jgi:hypothetical protein
MMYQSTRTYNESLAKGFLVSINNPSYTSSILICRVALESSL